MKKKFKGIMLSILLIVTMVLSVLPVTTKAAVRFDRINSVILDNSNRLKSINFDYSWLGGDAYISFVLLNGKIGYNGPDSLYGHFCLNASESERKHSFQASLDYIASLYPNCTAITHTGSPNGGSNNQMPYSEGFTPIGSKTIEFGSYTIGSDHPNKVYLYQWAYDGGANSYYPDALVAVFEMKSDGLYYVAGDGEPTTRIPFTYTVTLNKSGGTGGTSSTTVAAGSAMPTITPPTKTGYTFDGYYSETNGNGTKYYNNSGQSAHVYDIGNSATLYANWIANEYEVTFDVNGGDSLEVGEATKTVTYDGKYGDLPEPTREGYTFQGWYTDDSFTNKITSTDTVNITSDTTLVAKWLVIPGEVSTTESNDSDVETSIVTDDDDIINVIPLTTEDEEKLEDGKDLYVFAEVTDISKVIPSSDKKLVEEVLNANEEVGSYFDISIFKQFENEEKQLVPTADGNLRISMQVPKDLKDKEGLKILKITDGNVEEVEITLDGTSLMFDINSSSTYALVYTKSNNPNTGDNVIFSVLLLFLSLFVIFSIYTYIRKNKYCSKI